MKLTIQQCLFLLALPVAVSAQWRPVSDFGVVNIIPHDQSAETDENAEPSIGVAAGGGKFVVHAFSPDNSFANRYFTSTDNGIHWTNTGTLLDHDAALAWSPRGDAYAAILLPSHTAMNVLRS